MTRFREHEGPVRLPDRIGGFMQAADRFEVARRNRLAALPAYYALFESLAWTYSIDERLDKPRQAELRGLRYACNRVHHRWESALWMNLGGELRLVLDQSKLGVVSEWRWRESLGGGRHSDRPTYELVLAGRPARETLNALRAYLAPMVNPETLAE